MKIPKTNITRSPITKMAMITVLSCVLIMYGTAPFKHGGADDVFSAAMTINAVVFIAWLIWAICVLVTKRRLKPMSPQAYKLLDGIDFVLFAYWIVAWFISSATGPWIVWPMAAIWLASLIITIRDLNHKPDVDKE